MNNWELEIEKAKKEVINEKIKAWSNKWRDNWYKEHRKEIGAHAPEPPSPPKEVTEVKAWFITEWGNGFVVCDLEELMKQPKRKRELILALGGIRKAD